MPAPGSPHRTRYPAYSITAMTALFASTSRSRPPGTRTRAPAGLGDVRTPHLIGRITFTPRASTDKPCAEGAGGWYWARRHAGKSQYAHQPLHPLAVNLVSQTTQVNLYFAAAVKRMPRVFSVNQPQQRQFLLVRFCGHVWRINRGAVDTRQFALPG